MLAGCGEGGGAAVEGPVTVYASLPLTGPRGVAGRAVADGARLALEQAGGETDGLDVRLQVLDDARGAAWSPAAVGANARAAAQDSSAAAYIGELDSQPTRTSLPITNEAGLAQISPTAGAVDLARPAAGYPDSPGRYRPSGEVTFARLVAADDEVAAAAAQLALEQGYESVRVPAGDDAYENVVARAFTAAAAEVGLETTASGRAEGRMRALPEGVVAVVPGPEARTQPVTAGAQLRSFEDYGYEAMQLALQAIGDAIEGDGELRSEVVGAALGAERPDSVLGPYSLHDGEPDLCVRPCPRG